MRHRLMLAFAGSVALITVANGGDASARDGAGVVTACSKFGKGCISGPTRPGRFGAEVRMPGGTWISCKGDCRDALREETVDFWAQREFERGGGGRGRSH
jgi:hypothetical protein